MRWPRLRLAYTPVTISATALHHYGGLNWPARNRARLSVDVQNFQVGTRAGTAFSFPGWQLIPTLPRRLEQARKRRS